MWNRKRTALAAAGLMVVAIALAGAALAQVQGGPHVLRAQTPTPQPQRGGYKDFFLDQLAQSLGVSRSQLEDALKKAANATVDKAAQDGRLSPEQAARLHERINQGDGRFFGLFGGPHRGPGFGPPAGREFGLGPDGVLGAIATQLNIPLSDLLAQLRSGTSLKDIAAARGVTDLNTLKPGIISTIQNQLRQRGVSEDRINQITQRIQNADLGQLPPLPRKYPY